MARRGGSKGVSLPGLEEASLVAAFWIGGIWGKNRFWSIDGKFHMSGV